MQRIDAVSAGRAAPPRPKLEVRDLELVLALADSGSTQAAARTLHITQSAVSRALCQAEAHLGVPLFERNARGVLPTAAGERLIHGAQALLMALRELEQRVSAPALAPTRVRLVCECYTAYRWLPSTLMDLRRRVPELQVEICSEHTQDPLLALDRGQIDVALLTTSSSRGLPHARARFRERPLLADEVVFLVAPSHPLADAKTLSRDDLRRYPLITHAPPAERRWFLARVFGRSRPKLASLSFPLTEAIIDAARSGMGVAVLSEWMASHYLAEGGLCLKRLRRGPLLRPWHIAYRREAEGPAEHLRAVLAASAPRIAASAAAAPRDARRIPTPCAP